MINIQKMVQMLSNLIPHVDGASIHTMQAPAATISINTWKISWNHLVGGWETPETYKFVSSDYKNPDWMEKKQDGSHEPGSSHVFLDHILVETLLEVLWSDILGSTRLEWLNW